MEEEIECGCTITEIDVTGTLKIIPCETHDEPIIRVREDVYAKSYR